MHKRILSLLFIASCLLFIGVSKAHAQEIDFLIQGDTYTPAFYKGLPLWSNQSRIIIVGMPNIPGISTPSSLIYKWSQNGTILGGELGVNGVGRNSLMFTDSVLGKTQTIKLEILSNAGSILASDTIVVTSVSPSLLVYENNPLYGFIFHKEAGVGYSLKGREVTFTAFPLFFSAENRLDPLIQYSWRTNTGGSENKNSVTYRTPEGVVGSSQVTAEAKHRDKIIQAERKSFLVEFGK